MAAGAGVGYGLNKLTAPAFRSRTSPARPWKASLRPARAAAEMQARAAKVGLSSTLRKLDSHRSQSDKPPHNPRLDCQHQGRQQDAGTFRNQPTEVNEATRLRQTPSPAATTAWNRLQTTCRKPQPAASSRSRRSARTWSGRTTPRQGMPCSSPAIRDPRTAGNPQIPGLSDEARSVAAGYAEAVPELSAVRGLRRVKLGRPLPLAQKPS